MREGRVANANGATKDEDGYAAAEYSESEERAEGLLDPTAA